MKPLFGRAYVSPERQPVARFALVDGTCARARTPFLLPFDFFFFLDRTPFGTVPGLPNNQLLAFRPYGGKLDGLLSRVCTVDNGRAVRWRSAAAWIVRIEIRKRREATTPPC